MAALPAAAEAEAERAAHGGRARGLGARPMHFPPGRREPRGPIHHRPSQERRRRPARPSS